MDSKTIAEKLETLREQERTAWEAFKIAEQAMKPMEDKKQMAAEHWCALHRKIEALELVQKMEATAALEAAAAPATPAEV